MCTNRFFVPFGSTTMCIPFYGKTFYANQPIRNLLSAIVAVCVCFFFYYQMRFLLYFIWVVVVLVWFRRENSNHTADSSNGIVFFSLYLNVRVRKSACILPSANVRLSIVLLIWFFIMIMLNYYGDVYKMCINFRWKCNNAIMHNGHRNKSRRLVEHTIVSWDFCAILFFKQEKKNTQNKVNNRSSRLQVKRRWKKSAINWVARV